jgi:sugar lactone lactonase YvrE
MKTRTLSSALAGIISFLSAAVSAQLTVTTVINNGLREPYGVVVDALGNFYVCDSANNRIVRVDASTQAASTLAGIAGETGSNDGPPDLAHFNSPQGLLTVTIGGVSGLLVADSGNNLIRFVRFSDGVVTTLAGQTAGGPAVNAAGSTATFRSPIGLDQDANGNVYIADWGNNTIREVNLNDPAFGITNVVISGTSFNRPMAVAFAGTNQLWVADTGSQMIKLITLATPTNGNFTAWLGGDRLPGTNDASFGPNARFNSPSGLLWLSGVGLLISDTLNNSIRLATNCPAYGATNYAVVTWAGTPGNGGLQDGSAATAKFNSPIGLAQDILYNGLLVADLKNNVIRRIQTGPPPAPVPPPAVGWVDFTTPPADVVSVLRTNSPFIFHNDVTIAIAGTAGAEIHFTCGPTGSSIPNPDPTTGGTPPFYRDGMFPNQAPPSIVPPQPDVTVKAIGFAPGRRSSDVVSARFQFKTANPVVSGNNAAMFTVTDQTDSAQMWYTIDGSDPTNAAPSLGPINSGASLSLNASFNLTFRICAFRANYLNSDIITAFFSPTNFVPNIFKSPLGIALDTSGAQLFVADLSNNAVQVLHLGNNQTETFLDASAGILQPVDVVVDATNNVYVLNQGTGGNGSILQFDQFGNLLGTNAAGLAMPTALTVDNFGNVFVAEKGGAVQQFNSGSSSTLFTITHAGVQLEGIALFSDGTIALSDAGNHVIWQVNPVTYAVTLLTGTPGVPGTTLGAARFAKLNQPYRLARAAGNLLVAADYGNNRLVVVDRAGAITNVLNSTNASVWYGGAEDPQASSGAQLIPMVAPIDVALGNDGGVYASEVVNKDVRKISGTGLLPPPALPYLHLFRSPMGIALDTSGAQLYIADALSNAVQVLHLGNNQTETFLDASAGILNPVDVVVDYGNHVHVLNQGTGGNGSVLEFNEFGNLLSTNASGLAMPTALVVDDSGNVFIAEQGGALEQFNSGVSNTLFTITNAGVQLEGIALFDDGAIAVSDAGNHVIWQFNPATKAVTLLTGTLGVPGTTLGLASFAKLNQPYRLARAAGNLLVAADYGNNRLVVVDRAGAITNILNSTNASVWYGRSDDPQASTETQLIPMASPVGVVVGIDGGVYASEAAYYDIRKLVNTGLASTPTPDFPSPVFNSPRGLALNTVGSFLYIADLTNNAIKALDLANNLTTTFLNASNGISRPVDVVVDSSDNLYVLNQSTLGNGSIMEFDHFGNLLGTIATNLALPTALGLDGDAGLFVTEQAGTIQQFLAGTSNNIVTITNVGVQLQGLAFFDDGTIAISDAGNHVIWQFNSATQAVTLLTGTVGVPGNTLGAVGYAKLNQPLRLARAAGNLLVAVDYGNNRLVVIDRSGSITNVLNSTNALVWYGRTDDPHASSDVLFPPMAAPVGVVLDYGGEVFTSEALYNDIRKLLSTGLAYPPPPPPVPLPSIGWVEYPPPNFVSVLRTDQPFVFHNDITIAIAGTGGSETHFTYGATGTSIPDPDASTGSTPPLYPGDGSYPSQVPPTFVPIQPDFTMKAVGFAPLRQNSGIVSARFQFKTANPEIAGNNAAFFTISTQTTNAQMYYTIDGSDPTPTSTNSLGPITSGASLSFDVGSGLSFRVRAYRANYQPSDIVSATFTPGAFQPNSVSFGFSSGEASSDFICSAGQFFYAPVTLTPLPSTTIYSLQFNLTVTTNITVPYPAGSPGPAVAPGAYSFQSFLEKPIPGTTPPVYERIPPLMFAEYALNPPPPEQIRFLDFLPFVNLVFTNSALNLLGVGWLERYGQTNLYDTTKQTLISFSEPHDTMFTPDMGKVVLGGYAFQVPGSAAPGQTYQIQIGRPSATSDGIGRPGSDVYIATPTDGSLTNGAMNSLKIVTVGQRKYIAGDCAPFRWFNAGDFGNTNLDNSDVMQVFQSAIYSLNYPPPGSDFYDSMDSCGGFGGLDPATGYYTNSLDVTNLNVLFDGNDTLINQIPFGNYPPTGLDVCDVYVTFRRSLDPSLTWYRRFWTNGVLEAEPVSQTNLHAQVRSSDTPLQPKLNPRFLTNPPSVNFAAADVTASVGQTLQVPITARIFGDYPLRVLMLNLSVEPLDGSPDLTSPVQFKPNAALGTAAMTSSTGNGNYAAGWLSSTIPGLIDTATLGTLIVTIPANAPSSAAYAIHFDHASASPNGIASFAKQTSTGLILLSDRSGSVFNDGIPDSWRLRYFGTVNNILSQAAADADGDGANNWQEYIAGTDPTDPKSVLLAFTDQAAAQQSQECVVRWPSVAGKRYLIERSSTLYGPNWIPVSTNTGSGADMEFRDSIGGDVRFYRVQVIP